MEGNIPEADRKDNENQHPLGEQAVHDPDRILPELESCGIQSGGISIVITDISSSLVSVIEGDNVILWINT